MIFKNMLKAEKTKQSRKQCSLQEIKTRQMMKKCIHLFEEKNKKSRPKNNKN